VAELRWLLLLIGICIIAAVYIYTRYKPRIADQVRTLTFRKEPSFGDLAVGTGAEQLSPTKQTPEPDPIIAIPSISQEPRKIITIRLMSTDTKGFVAERLILILRELGLRHGQFGIFHRLVEDAAGEVAFSVASLVEPGSFDLTKIKTEQYPGISMFMTLPGPIDGVTSFDEMMNVAREIAQQLDGYLLDEQGGTLSIQRERYMREEIIRFEHEELS
jgi:cell division protein ZipA